MQKRLSSELFSGRLSLCPLEGDDIEALHSLWTDEPVRRFLWDGEVIPLERTRKIVAQSNDLFDAFRYGLWGIRERGFSELLGFAGYWHFRKPRSLELLYGVASSHWARGIATESGRRLIRYAFEDLGFRTVAASADFGNCASIRVLEKLGMLFQRRAVVDGLDTVFFRVTRDAWETALQSPRAAPRGGPRAEP